MGRASKLMVLGVAVVLVAAACGDDDASLEESTATTSANTSTAPAAPSAGVVAPLATEVTETHTIPGFGYSIGYPAGWFVETRGSITAIARTEEQLQARFADPIPPREALGVNLDHRTVAFLQTLGLTSDDPTAQDLLEFNTSNFDWTDVRDLGEVELFGTTAVVARITTPDGDVAIEYQGILPDNGEIFLFGVAALTEERLDAFLPAWEAMLGSIVTTE